MPPQPEHGRGPAPAAATDRGPDQGSDAEPGSTTTAYTSSTRLTRSDDETAALGRWLGERLPPAVVVHLLGDLGAGKTVFVRGLAEGLGIDPAEVSSPTFTLIQEYEGIQENEGQGPRRRKLFHVDLYRLAGAEVGDLGLDALAADGVVAIEWANRLPDPDPRAITVQIDDAGDDRRRITIHAPSDLLVL